MFLILTVTQQILTPFGAADIHNKSEIKDGGFYSHFYSPNQS